MYAVPAAQSISTLETIILQPRSFPSSQEYCQECVDRTNLQATITNESREAAPRLRHHGVPHTTSHTCLVHCKDVCRDSKSLRLYQPAGPRPCWPLGPMVTAGPGQTVTPGPCRLAQQPLRAAAGGGGSLQCGSTPHSLSIFISPTLKVVELAQAPR